VIDGTARLGAVGVREGGGGEAAAAARRRRGGGVREAARRCGCENRGAAQPARLPHAPIFSEPLRGAKAYGAAAWEVLLLEADQKRAKAKGS